MSTKLSVACAVALLSVAAAGTALAGRPVRDGDNPYAGSYRTSWWGVTRDVTIESDGTFTGTLKYAGSGGRSGGFWREAGAEGDSRRGSVASGIAGTASGTVSDAGRMDVVWTLDTGTVAWDGWVSLDGVGDLVVDLDDSDYDFTLERR